LTKKYDDLVKKYGEEAVNKVVKLKVSHNLSSSQRKKAMKELEQAEKKLEKQKSAHKSKEERYDGP
jgi:hypothetical protein